MLMAVLNGENFLREQIDSIVNQEGCCVEIQVGDDGSTDFSLKILSEYVKKGLIASVIPLNQVGFTVNFLTLLNQVQQDRYVAFSDQDDVWGNEKLRKMLKVASEDSKPTLVFSRRGYIDRDGKITGTDVISLVEVSWHNAVVQNIAPGNTMLLNPAAVDLLKSLGQPDVKYYDSWIYLVLSLLGKVKFVNEDLVYYRLHDGNAIGLRKNYNFSKALDSIDNYLRQAKVVADSVANRSDLQTPKSFLMFVNRISDARMIIKFCAVLRNPIVRQNAFETALFKFGIAWCVLFRTYKI